jgi:hypothetical protein
MTKLNDTAIADYIDFKIEVRRAGANNRLFANAVSQLENKYSRKEKMVERGILSEEAGKQLASMKRQEMAKMYADFILTGWENVKIGGKKVEFSKENAAKFLADEENEIIFVDLIQFSADQAHFEKELDADAEKNSQKS